jgi:hypothetical protein
MKGDTVNITLKEYNALDRVRYNLLAKSIKEIQDILLEYYPAGTKIEITKDLFNISNDRSKD